MLVMMDYTSNQNSFDSIEENLVDSNSTAYKAYRVVKESYENVAEDITKAASTMPDVDTNGHWKSLLD